jgi:hypothetical protein
MHRIATIDITVTTMNLPSMHRIATIDITVTTMNLPTRTASIPLISLSPP